MTRPDFDAIATSIWPEPFAKAIGAKPGRNGSYHCPGNDHEFGDRDPSLSISRKAGRTVGCCHACGLKGTPVQIAADVWSLSQSEAAERLVSEIGITVPAKPNGSKASGNGLGELIETYDYDDEQGEYLFSVRRFALPKSFRQGRRQGPGGWTWGLGDTRRVLYNLSAVVAGIEADRWILIAEGEKDVDELVSRGFVATCNPMGAGNWKGEYTPSLKGAKVCIIPDDDDPGREHAQAVAEALQGVAAEVRILELPGLEEKGDVYDWFEAGGTDEELEVLVEAAPVWQSSANAGTSPRAAEEFPDGRTDASPHLTDLGNAQRFARLHGDRVRYVGEWGTPIVWDERRWAKDRTGEVERLAQATVREMHREALEIDDRARAAEMSKHALRCESEARLRSMVSLARVMGSIPVVPEELDADPWLFNVENGTIDLKTGKLREHDLSMKNTSCGPTSRASGSSPKSSSVKGSRIVVLRAENTLGRAESSIWESA